MAKDTAWSKSITSFTLSPPTNFEKLVHLLIEEPMEALLPSDDVFIIEKSD